MNVDSFLCSQSEDAVQSDHIVAAVVAVVVYMVQHYDTVRRLMLTLSLDSIESSHCPDKRLTRLT